MGERAVRRVPDHRTGQGCRLFDNSTQLATMCGIINWKMRALKKRNKWNKWKMANGKLPLAVKGDAAAAAAAEWVKCEARQP